MTKEQREATELYDLISTRGVHPISKADAKIIGALTDLVTQMGANSKLIEALKAWKSEADVDILGRLEQLDLDDAQDVSGAMKNAIDFISFEGKDLLVKSLFSFKSYDSYDTGNNMPVYRVVINETDNPNLHNGNTVIEYEDEDDRDNALLSLKDKLKEFTHIRFI